MNINMNKNSRNVIVVLGKEFYATVAHVSHIFPIKLGVCPV